MPNFHGWAEEGILFLLDLTALANIETRLNPNSNTQSGNSKT
ncbi:hypothetical protein Celaphus_00008760, partial [Cervus elaphus hippelaphus]